MKMSKVLLAAIASTIAIGAFASASANTPQVFGYYTNWDTYGNNYQPTDIPTQDVTAVMYAFAEIGNCAAPYATPANPALCNAGSYNIGDQDYKLHSTDPYSDFTKIPTGYLHAGDTGKGNMAATINQLHKSHKNVLLSIGGYSLSAPLTTLINSGAKTQLAFEASVVAMLNQVKSNNNGDGFDGVDVDWEPGDNGWTFLDNPATAASTLENYINFISNLQAYIKANYESYAWLTVALPANPNVVNKINTVYKNATQGSFFGDLAKHVDYMDVMAYDYHGSFDNPKLANFNAPVVFDPKEPTSAAGYKVFNVTSTIDAYLAAGAPSNKLVIGFPAYGRKLNVAPGANNNGLYQAFTGAGSVVTYKDILTMLNNGFVPHQETTGSDAVESYAYNPTAGGWISYDDPTVVKAKADLVKKDNLAGLMEWSLSGDAAGDDSLIHHASQDLASTAK
ncbi:MAG: glycoside hydrolase family 18 protein [Coxiellaceae bacterium]|nr:glycoside hydrolase family 18 protein [Coxiellaceae bacterium]